MGIVLQFRNGCPEVFGGKAAFLLFPGLVDLQQHILHLAQFHSRLFQMVQDLQAVHTFDHVKMFHRMFGLVGLQMADQMPVAARRPGYR